MQTLLKQTKVPAVSYQHYFSYYNDTTTILFKQEIANFGSGSV
jgi:hypothetical protein